MRVATLHGKLDERPAGDGPMTRPRLIRCAAAVLSVVLLASCSGDVVGEDVMPLARGESLDEMRQQAGRILARYDAAVAKAGSSASPSVEVPFWDAGGLLAGKAIDAAEPLGRRAVLEARQGSTLLDQGAVSLPGTFAQGLTALGGHFAALGEEFHQPLSVRCRTVPSSVDEPPAEPSGAVQA
ncbi:hypothetical protein ADL15_00625 [Actinoplanes awajinensis subsp. mycoplanecinus]|uniref:Uncharacterized protein n=1 Tax=Actinoplanes awajinensis subsp. mycoplanecinus TaxID=135947 RepID=A0A0X3VCA0_9ACTN|nr:hypothetical protein ADL15_00625 [Actinoplanes awajinensis subsp. mycoplanecinus]